MSPQRTRQRRATMDLFTIGFTQSSAEHFFNRLKSAGAHRVIDVRLNNTSQLAGFAKGNDLPWFLRTLCDIDYQHEPLLAPTEEIVQLGRAKQWIEWEAAFRALMKERQAVANLRPAMFAGACLLCAEAQPHHCHRRIIAELIAADSMTQVNVVHL
jgi:uncharacterized protein (DUF488 family)